MSSNTIPRRSSLIQYPLDHKEERLDSNHLKAQRDYANLMISKWQMELSRLYALEKASSIESSLNEGVLKVKPSKEIDDSSNDKEVLILNEKAKEIMDNISSTCNVIEMKNILHEISKVISKIEEASGFRLHLLWIEKWK